MDSEGAGQNDADEEKNLGGKISVTKRSSIFALLPVGEISSFQH